MDHRVLETPQGEYKSLDEKPFESLYLYVEATLERTVDEVWPHALNIGSWMNAHRLVTIAGESANVGHLERVYPRGLDAAVPLPHYHLYGIAEIIPYKLIALEVLPEKGGSYGKTRPKMSFDSILLTDMGGKTHLGFLLVDVHLGKGDSDFYLRRKGEIEAARGMIAGFFENLRRLVEKQIP